MAPSRKTVTPSLDSQKTICGIKDACFLDSSVGGLVSSMRLALKKIVPGKFLPKHLNYWDRFDVLYCLNRIS